MSRNRALARHELAELLTYEVSSKYIFSRAYSSSSPTRIRELLVSIARLSYFFSTLSWEMTAVLSLKDGAAAPLLVADYVAQICPD